MAQKKNTMEYRNLGNTGIKVSVISYGNMMTQDTKEDEDKYIACVKKAYELGVNFFDNAEAYGYGICERQLGKAIQALYEDGAKREDLVISTKIYNGWIGPEPTINNKGLNRKHVIEGTKNSLQRLQLDYVDLIFCHRHDPTTPIEEVCRAFDQVIRNGWALYWGTSEWSAYQIMEAFYICSKFNLIPPAFDQTEYNMLRRERFENEYRGLFESYGYGSTVWGPLCGGILTGRYNEAIPEDSRGKFAESNPAFSAIWLNKYLGPQTKEETRKKLAEFGKIAKELGHTQTQLALAWALWNKNVSTALTGGNKPQYIEDAVGAVELLKKWTPELDARVEKILNNSPDFGINYMKSWTPNSPVRQQK